MSRSFQEIFALMANKVDTGIGIPMDVIDFRHLILAIDSVSSGNFTLKVQGSIQTAKPDFAASQSQTNQWSYIQIKDLADASTINGATGVVATGTDIHKLYEINTNALKWVNVVITAISAGGVYAGIVPVNDAI